MKDPSLWIIFTALFVLAGLLNLARGVRGKGKMGSARLALAASCMVWAMASAAFRFAGDSYGLALALVAVVIMLAASLLRMRDTN